MEIENLQKELQTFYNEETDLALENLYQAIKENFVFKNFTKNKTKIFQRVFNYAVCSLGLQDRDINFVLYKNNAKQYISEILNNMKVFGDSNDGRIRLNILRADVNKKVVESFNTICHECVHQLNAKKNKEIFDYNYKLLEDFKSRNKNFLPKLRYIDDVDLEDMGVDKAYTRLIHITCEDEKLARILAAEMVHFLFKKLYEIAKKDESLSKRKKEWFNTQRKIARSYERIAKREMQDLEIELSKNLEEIKKHVNQIQRENVKSFIENEEESLFFLFNDKTFENQTKFCFDPKIFANLLRYEMNFLKNENASIVLSFLTESHGGFEIARQAYPHLKEILAYGLPEKCPQKFVYRAWCDSISSKEVFDVLKDKYGSEEATNLLINSASKENFSKYFEWITQNSETKKEDKLLLKNNKSNNKEMCL